MTSGGIDWSLAERVAVRVASRLPRHDGASISDASLEPFVADAAARVSDETGLHPPGAPLVRVVDRAEWATASIAAFRALLGPTLQRMSERSPGYSLRAMGGIGGLELGLLTGWLSGKVLGQYDMLVAADQDDADVVYVVGPNLAALERRFGFDPDQFRTWVVLHELTHRAQFRGVPWMRDHYLALVGDVLGAVDNDPNKILAALREAIADRETARRRIREGGAAALFMEPDQRAALERVGGLMSLLEGHGDVVMDRAGADILPDAERFSRVLRERRRQVNPIARLVQQLLGFEAKLNQYRAGEEFVAAIEAAEGPRVVDLCWAAPDNLPTTAEIREPQGWLARMGVARALV